MQVTSVNSLARGSFEVKTKLAPNGRIVIPAVIREEMGFAPGDTLLLEVEDGVLRVESFDARLARIQDELVELVGPERLLSDELIAERRAEAWREQVEADRERQAMQEHARKAG